MVEEVPSLHCLSNLAFVKLAHERCIDQISDKGRDARWVYHDPAELIEEIGPLLSIGDAYTGLAHGINILRNGLGDLEKRMSVETAQILKLPEREEPRRDLDAPQRKPEEITISKKDYVFIPSFGKEIRRLVESGVEKINAALSVAENFSSDEELEMTYWQVNDAMKDCYSETDGIRAFVAFRSLKRGMGSLREQLFPTPLGNSWELETNMKAYFDSLKKLREFVKGKTEIGYSYQRYNYNRVENFKAKKPKPAPTI